MTTFLGNPVTFTGKQLQVGDIAKDFLLIATDLSQKSLKDFEGKKKVISVVPSIDTGICSKQTRTFNVSMDLPFAQKRWCSAEGLDNVILLSDFYDHSFGQEYALLMNEWHLLTRAVLILDEHNKVTYTEYVDNVNSDVDYEAAINAAKILP